MSQAPPAPQPSSTSSAPGPAPARPAGFFAVAGIGSAVLIALDLGRDAPTIQLLRLSVVLAAPIAWFVAHQGLPAVAMNLMLAVAFVVMSGIGLLGGAMYFVALLPLVAGYYEGRNAAIGWALAALAAVGSAPLLDPLFADEVVIDATRRASGDMTFVLLALALAILTRRQHSRQLSETHSRQSALERLNQELSSANQQARDARSEAERATAERTALLARMSHEVRTPLAAVQGLVGVLREEPLPAQTSEIVASIEGSTASLRRLVDDMLDLARLDAGRLVITQHAFDVRSAVEDVVDLFVGSTSARGVELCGLIDPAVPARIVGDETRFAQILGNLVGNAIRFTEAGEVVIEVRWDERGGGLIVTVRDTGAGIAPARLAKLFTPFEQGGEDIHRRYGGSGLGLSLVREMLSAMGGTIEVRSRVGQGTSFIFTIPWSGADPSADTTGSLELGARGKSLLALEPHDATRESLVALAIHLGIEVLTARSAAELAEVARRTRPSLVLIGAESNLDALAAAEVAQSALPDVPRVLAVGPGQPELANAAITSGHCSTTTLRPVRRSRLLAVLEESSLRADEAALDPPRVLVVDDDPVNRRVTARMLHTAGAEVVDAATGEAGLEAILAGGLDLALLDLHLPGIDGAELARRVCDALPSEGRPRMIALTASDLAADRARCAQAGMEGYLVRPVSLGTLLGLVEEATRRRRRAQHGANRARPASSEFGAFSAEDSTEIRAHALDELVALFGPEEAGEVVGEFLVNSRVLFDELVSALRSGKRSDAHRAMHTLASSARAVGAEQVARMARAAEARLRAPEDGDTNLDIESLREAMVRTERALRAWSKRPASASEDTSGSYEGPTLPQAPIVIRLDGHLSRATLEAKLADADRKLKKGMSALVDCTQMTSYDLDARHAFAAWNTRHRKRIAHVAVITPNVLWASVVRAMAAVSQQELRAFSDAESAKAWLDLARRGGDSSVSGD